MYGQASSRSLPLKSCTEVVIWSDVLSAETCCTAWTLFPQQLDTLKPLALPDSAILEHELCWYFVSVSEFHSALDVSRPVFLQQRAHTHERSADHGDLHAANAQHKRDRAAHADRSSSS